MGMKLLLYCTKAKPYLLNQNVYEFYDSKYITSNLKCHKDYDYTLNGKIVAECDFEVEEITTFKDYTGYEEYDIHYQTAKRDYERLLQETCLNNQQLDDYLQGENGYAIHIKNLHIFDKPREITDLVLLNQYRKDLVGTQYNKVKVAPQNMCLVDYSVEVFGKYDCTNHLLDSPYILISIQSQWLCKILNGEKTIEVRKKVLKEMLKWN